MASEKIHRAGVTVAYDGAHGEQRVRRAGLAVAYWESEPRLNIRRAGHMVAYWEDPNPDPDPVAGEGPFIVSAGIPRANRASDGVRLVSAGQPTRRSAA